MTHLYLRFTFLLACTLVFSLSASAQYSEETSTRIVPVANVELDELVLLIPEMSSKIGPDIIGTLQKLNGVSYDSYCPWLKTIFLRYDREIINDSEIIEAIQEKNDFKYLKIESKQGSISEVKQHCLKFSDK